MVLLTEHGQMLGLLCRWYIICNVSDDQRFELYAIGAPQRHGQNLYKQNIATYSQELAGVSMDTMILLMLKERSLSMKR